MIFLDKDTDYLSRIKDDVNDNKKQKISAENRMKLIARATLDKRLNARDLKLYNYVMCYEYLSLTQEQISEMLDISRSNINKSLEKLASFNYIEKIQLQKGIKKMAYKLKSLSEAGIINANSSEIIRILNVSNIQNAELKLNYCSVEDVEKYKDVIKEYKKNIEIIEEFYDKEDDDDTHIKACKKTAQELVRVFGKPDISNKNRALNFLNSSIEQYQNNIKDVEDMEVKLDNFSKELVSQVKNVGRHVVDSVLRDENAKFILFIDRANEERFSNFKEKYLVDYIKFICKFTNLDKNENFFKIFYENKDIKLSYSDFIKLLGYNHREVPITRLYVSKRIKDDFDEFFETVPGRLTNQAAELVKEISDLGDAIDSMTEFNARELSLLLYVMNEENCMKKQFGLEFKTFVKMYNEDLLDKFFAYSLAKEKAL